MKNIALLYGSFNGEDDVSRKSANNIQRVYLDFVDHHAPNSAYNLIPVEVLPGGFMADWKDDRIKIDLNDFTFLENGNKINFACIFFIVHGRPVEDGQLQGYFEMIGLPYVGSNGRVSSLTFDKFNCSKFVSNFNISIADSTKVTSIDAIPHLEKFPVFVKPNFGGSSIGAEKIESQEKLTAFLNQWFPTFDEYLIEEYLPGQELTCGVYRRRVNGKSEVTVLSITEIISKNSFFDYEAKYQGASEEITPARIPPELTQSIQSTTRKIFDLLRCDGFARVDYMVVEDTIYFIEINTIPGFSEQSLVPQQLAASGIDTGEFVQQLLDDLLV